MPIEVSNNHVQLNYVKKRIPTHFEKWAGISSFFLTEQVENFSEPHCPNRSSLSSLSGSCIDIMRMQLVVHDFLAGVKPVIAGKHIAYGTGYAKEQHAFVAKQLYAE